MLKESRAGTSGPLYPMIAIHVPWILEKGTLMLPPAPLLENTRGSNMSKYTRNTWIAAEQSSAEVMVKLGAPGSMHVKGIRDLREVTLVALVEL